METKENDRLENIKLKILELVTGNGLVRNGIKNDSEGHIYCISNSLYKIYSIKIYKLRNKRIFYRL